MLPVPAERGWEIFWVPERYPEEQDHGSRSALGTNTGETPERFRQEPRLCQILGESPGNQGTGIFWLTAAAGQELPSEGGTAVKPSHGRGAGSCPWCQGRISSLLEPSDADLPLINGAGSNRQKK